MMDQQEYDNDIEIYWHDLVKYLLKHLKTFFIFVIVGALLGFGLYAYKASSQSNFVKNFEFEDDEVQENMELAYSYRKLYANQLAYNQNSALMQLNTEEVYQGTLEYYVESGKDTNYLMAKYDALLLDNALWDQIKEASGLDTEVKYLKELIDINVYIPDQNDSTVVSSSLDVISNGKGFVIKITVNMPDEATCQSVMDVIDDGVLSIEKQTRESYSDYVFTSLVNDISVVSSTDLYNQQTNAYNQLNNYQTQYTTIEGKLTSDELQYYEIVYLDEEQEPISPVKYIAVGVVGFAVLWMLIYVMIYILVDKTIKTADEFRDTYGINQIGVIDPKDSSSNMQAYLTATINQLPQKKILLSGDLTNNNAQSIISSLHDSCSNTIATGLLSKDDALVQQAKDIDGVILFIGLKKTLRADEQRELEICLLHQIPVLGFVAIEE